MKTIILPAIALFAVAASPAGASEAQRFAHDGRIYSYTVTTVGDQRVISGVEEATGKRFTLRVGERRVRGTVGSQQVSFPLKDVEPLAKPATKLAAR